MAGPISPLREPSPLYGIQRYTKASKAIMAFISSCEAEKNVYYIGGFVTHEITSLNEINVIVIPKI